jgi:pimeloyl-ACP methyl ester carboxylesterase
MNESTNPKLNINLPFLQMEINGWSINYMSFVRPSNAYKPPIIILAGLFESFNDSIEEYSKLSEDNPLYVVHMPGLGDNEEVGSELTYSAYGMLLSAFMDNLGVAECVLMANTYSANIAICFSEHYEDRLLELIFVAPVVKIRDSVEYLLDENLKSLENGDMKTFAARQTIHFIPTFSESFSGKRKEIVKDYYLSLLRSDKFGFEKYCSHINRLKKISSNKDIIKGVKSCKVTVIAGASDLLSTPQESFDFSNACTNSTFVMIEDSDHLMIREKKSVLFRLFKRILEKKPIKRMRDVKLIESNTLDRKFVRVTSRHDVKERGHIECLNGEIIPVEIDNLSQFGCKFTVDDGESIKSLNKNLIGCKLHLDFVDLRLGVGVFELTGTDEFRGIFSHESFNGHEKLQSYLYKFSHPDV